MEVRCEKCQARYRVDDARIGPAGLTMRCGKCQNTFRVTKPGTGATPAAGVAGTPAAAGAHASGAGSAAAGGMARSPASEKVAAAAPLAAAAPAEAVPPVSAAMDGLPPPEATASEPRAPAQNRSLTPAKDTRVAASIAARPRSKAVLVAIVVLLVLAITALLVRQKLGPSPRPGTALQLLFAPPVPAAGPTK